MWRRGDGSDTVPAFKYGRSGTKHDGNSIILTEPDTTIGYWVSYLPSKNLEPSSFGTAPRIFPGACSIEHTGNVFVVVFNC